MQREVPAFGAYEAKDWDQARLIARNLQSVGSWVFRGHADSAWKLQTSLEREQKRLTNTLAGGIHAEVKMLVGFQRAASLVLPNVPDKENLLEWMALLQHHGGVSRLLDFSRSFYVAAFFALENASGKASIWAVEDFHLNVFAQRVGPDAKQVLRGPFEQGEYFNALLKKSMDSGIPLVACVEPEQLSERMGTQQGTFLCAFNSNGRFEDQLSRTLKLDADCLHQEPAADHDTPPGLVARIDLPFGCHKDAMDDLLSMNVTAATLFPGLDGFARSLKNHVRDRQENAIGFRRAAGLLGMLGESSTEEEGDTGS